MSNGKAMSEVVGNTHLMREVWECMACVRDFVLGQTIFDAKRGIVCPHCKSDRIAPVKQAVN